MGKDSYVWVLTSMEEVAYFYTPTREGSTIQAMLKNFSGVLVSDFYSADDAIECRQQKCLIHFIRDLNDELLKHPYDQGLKRVVGDFASFHKRMLGHRQQGDRDQRFQRPNDLGHCRQQPLSRRLIAPAHGITPELKRVVRAQYERFRPSVVLIEDKASGTS